MGVLCGLIVVLNIEEAARKGKAKEKRKEKTTINNVRSTVTYVLLITHVIRMKCFYNYRKFVLHPLGILRRGFEGEFSLRKNNFLCSLSSISRGALGRDESLRKGEEHVARMELKKQSLKSWRDLTVITVRQ